MRVLIILWVIVAIYTGFYFYSRFRRKNMEAGTPTRVYGVYIQDQSLGSGSVSDVYGLEAPEGPSLPEPEELKSESLSQKEK